MPSASPRWHAHRSRSSAATAPRPPSPQGLPYAGAPGGPREARPLPHSPAHLPRCLDPGRTLRKEWTMTASALRLGIALLLLGSAPLLTTGPPACAPTPPDMES